MKLTLWLVAFVALFAIAGTWRLVRWYWRPRLRLPADVSLERQSGGVRAYLEVRNLGAGRSRGCAARVIRCERRVADRWVRVDPLPHVGQNDGPVSSIPPGGTARVGLDRFLPDEAAHYRLEIAVIDGEERRGSYVIQVGEGA